ncbi:MAG: GIY-YIG nuclease family protein [Candidatus Shapirobacteria bacterium]|jgi:putative endonuclease
MFYVYFLKSQRNGKIYVGSTSQDPKTRLEEHNRRMNKFTKENMPFILLYFEKYLCKEDAALREKFYKSGFGRNVRNIIISVASAKGGSAFG